MVRLLPGDIIDILFGGDQTASEEVKQQAREQLGLNGSYLEQYWRWISGVVQGDFGFSLRNTEPVSNIVFDALTVTLELVDPRAADRHDRRRPARRALRRQARHALGRRGARRRPRRAQRPELLARDAAAPLHLTRVRLGAAARLHLPLRRPDREPEPVHPPGDLDLGVHDGDRDADGAGDDARGARTGLRPHRPRQGCRQEDGDLEARAAERPDPRRHDHRLRDRRADRRSRDHRDHLRAARRRLRAPAGDLRARLPGDPGDDPADRVHLHLRQPPRRRPLRGSRPEDLAGASEVTLDEPGGETRIAASPGWASGATRSGSPAPSSSSSTSSSPCSGPTSGRSTRTSWRRSASRVRAGRTRWAPTSSGGTRWRESSTARRCRCRSA